MKKNIFPQHEENQKVAKRLSINSLEEALKFPKFFEIETVNACNARCTMCTINDWEKVKDVIMSDTLYAKFVHEVAEYADWVDTVCLNRDGEPTLDKKLPQRVKMLKDVGMKKVTFATNAQLLTPKLVHELIDAGLDDIMISIDGITKETYEAIRLRLNYDVVLQNTLNLIGIRNERNSSLKVRIRMVLMESNQHELEEWSSFWNSKISPEKDDVYAKPAHTWGNQLTGEAESMIAKYADKPCIFPFSSMVIQVDGKVPMCNIDYNVKELMGDFSKESIQEIWNGEAFTQARFFHANKQRNQIQMCCGCSIWDPEVVIKQPTTATV
ncbi:radical SAM/SPASM domain-containing protein [Microcoleus sp. BROC3]|uniref:radical SAM/SPASM domain-containing protein n=1 Tax=Microcoleus sp. BROC3 TaxID=3055323 RepID=UPI002FD63C5C